MVKVWAYQEPGMKMEIHGRAELHSLQLGLPRSDTQNRSQPLLQCTMQRVPMRYCSCSIVLHMPSDVLRRQQAAQRPSAEGGGGCSSMSSTLVAPARGLSATLLIIELGGDSPGLNCRSCVVVDTGRHFGYCLSETPRRINFTGENPL